MKATLRAHVDVAKALLDRGADVGATDNYGWTALLWAASLGNLDLVKLFLDKESGLGGQRPVWSNRSHEGRSPVFSPQ